MANLLTFLSSRGIHGRKVSVNHGGEYHSYCPLCGDGGKGEKSDRFHVWPEKQSGGLFPGRFWCRRCGAEGDTIAFLQKVNGLSFVEAWHELGVVLNGRGEAKMSRYTPPPAQKSVPGAWRPATYPETCETWQIQAEKLLEECQHKLRIDSAAMEWLERRGINRPMATMYGLGYNVSRKGGDRYRPRTSWGLPEKIENGKQKRLWIPRGWVIPCRDSNGKLTQLRIRRHPDDIAAFGHRIKYLPIDGSSQSTLILHPDADVFAITESGFDAILLAGTMCGAIGAISTWNSSARPDSYAHTLLDAATAILGALDYDEAGDHEQAWWRGTYRQYHRMPPLPGAAKDPGDAFSAGCNLRRWMIDGMPYGLRIKLRLDGARTQTPPPVEHITAVQPVSGADEQMANRVVEITLSNGVTIYVTNDQPAWRELTDQGKPVFSENELARLKQATASMPAAERIAAAMQVIDAKQVFSGYVRDGRKIAEISLEEQP